MYISFLLLVLPASSLKIGEQIPDKLVYDIGMNRGDDTAAYLKQGYKVVAVEANPVWIKKNTEVFKDDIANGRLTILHNTVDQESGNTMSFWSANLKPQAEAVTNWLENNGYTVAASSASSVQHESGLANWLAHFDEASSTSEENACNMTKTFGSKNLGRCSDTHPMCTCDEAPVRSLTCTDMMKQYGVPHYLKIDIEGYDGLCMKNLATAPCSSLPPFISFEEQSIHPINVAGSEELITALSARGYSWKVSRQKFAQHFELGTGPFGEDVDDHVRGKVWSDATDAMTRAKKKLLE